MLSGRPKNLTLAPCTRSLLQIFQIDLGVVSRDESLQLRGREHPDPLRLDDGTEAANEGSCLVLDLRVHSKVGHQMDVANSVTNRGKQRKLTGQGGRLTMGWKTSRSALKRLLHKHKEHQGISPGQQRRGRQLSWTAHGQPPGQPRCQGHHLLRASPSQQVRQGGTTPPSSITVSRAPAKERALLSTKGLLFHFILLDINHLRYYSVLQRKTVSC